MRNPDAVWLVGVISIKKKKKNKISRFNRSNSVFLSNGLDFVDCFLHCVGACTCFIVNRKWIFVFRLAHCFLNNKKPQQRLLLQFIRKFKKSCNCSWICYCADWFACFNCMKTRKRKKSCVLIFCLNDIFDRFGLLASMEEIFHA